MKSLKGITSFVATARTGSFASAAKQLGVSGVAVSKNITTLEAQLGVRLLQRSTRQLTLTTEGRSYLDQCEGPLRELEAAQVTASKSNKALSGTVRLASVMPFGMRFILPLLPQFHALYPNVHVRLSLLDAANELTANRCDIGIRVGQLKDAAYVARPIAPLPFVVCASPSYFEAFGKPTTVTDLLAHNCLRFHHESSAAPAPWPIQGMDAALDERLTGNSSLNHFAGLVQSAIAGQGIICVPLPLVYGCFQTRQLLPVLKPHIRTDIQVFMFYPSRKNIPARTRVLIDFLLAQLGSDPILKTPVNVLLADF